MNAKSKNNLKKTVVNLFGMIGYFCCSLQWFWAILLYFSLILDVSQFFISNSDNQAVVETVEVVPVSVIDLSPSLFTVLITALVVVAVSLLSIYILYKIPSTIARVGERVVHKSANSIAPVVLQVQHKKHNEKNKLKLTPKLILVMKLALVIVPIVAAFISKSLEYQLLDFEIVLFVSLWLAVASLVMFCSQYLLSRFLHIKAKEII